MRDTHIRYPNDPAPLVVSQMGHYDLRYSWLPGDDPDVQRVRNEIQEEGHGLFVVALGGTGVKALIEAYYPEEIRPAYYKLHLDRHRKHDHDMGRLVAVRELFQWVGEMHPLMLEEIRRNNRNARSELRRAYNPSQYVRDMEDAEEEQTRLNTQDFEDFYADAYRESLKFALGTPRVSGYTPRQPS